MRPCEHCGADRDHDPYDDKRIIERLTAELAEAKEDASIDERISLRAQNFEQSRQLRELRAERDRLVRENNEWHKAANAGTFDALIDERDRLRAERDAALESERMSAEWAVRLRAALEHIIRYEEVDNDGNPMPESGASFIAKEALAGAPHV